MLKYLKDMRAQFELIRAMALKVDQPMIAYLAEMGISECSARLDEISNGHRS